jgi:hypothetical protein
MHLSKPRRVLSVKASAHRSILGNIRLLTAGCRSGVMLCNMHDRPLAYVAMVHHRSRVCGRITPGDSVLAVNGVNVSKENAMNGSKRIKSALMHDRELVVNSPPGAMKHVFRVLLSNMKVCCNPATKHQLKVQL